MSHNSLKMSQGCMERIWLSQYKCCRTNAVIETQSSHLTTVLLVDDDDAVRVPTRWFLNSFGYEVESVRSAEEALALFDSTIHDLVVTDNSMPGMSGAELAHIIKMRSPNTPVIMYSGAAPADQSCLDSVIIKPAHLLVLKAAIERLVAPLDRV